LKNRTAGTAVQPAFTAYAAGFVAFAYALVSLYWAVGGHGLISTVGGYVEHFAHRRGALPVLAALAVAGAKLAGGLLAGFGPSLGAGCSAQVAAARFSRSQHATDGVRRS
jgi:hypothetical protein